MQIGVMAGGTSNRAGLDDLATRARDLESRGFATMWIPNLFGLDAITASAVVGRETERIELGTAVVPTFPRHPTALAQQALTAGAACRGRFTLGIGLSHPPVIEGMLGLSYARRARHMREYMEVLGPLLRGEPAGFEGEEYRVGLEVRGNKLAIRRRRWKLIEADEEGTRELYDLERDPDERTNIARYHEDVVADLARRIAEWRARQLALAPPQPSLSEEEVERLRALGYVP